MPTYFVVYKDRNFNFCYKNVIVKYGKANRSGGDASENLVYYTHRSQERKYMECHGGEGRHKKSLGWVPRQRERGQLWARVFIVSHEATCKAG